MILTPEQVVAGAVLPLSAFSKEELDKLYGEGHWVGNEFNGYYCWAETVCDKEYTIHRDGCIRVTWSYAE